jgi:hypothetical protein
MFKYKRSLVSIVILICTMPVFAQSVTVKMTIDSTVMPIGQQSKMHLEISGPASLNYSFPTFPGDTLIKGIEIMARGSLDTLEINKNQIRLRTDYLITSFDSGLYYIPPVKILAGTDAVESNDLALKVVTYSVDTTKIRIFDIKGIQKPPFVLSDYILYILLFFLIYIIVLLIIWYVLRKKYGILKGEKKTDVPLLPPHVVAIMELDKLKSEKIWKDGKSKLFYTELTDILRKYIQRRFQINAMEMTSEEILTLFKRDRNTQSVFQNLKQILQLADMVKFAKIQPLENENEMSIMNSYLFVNQTKIDEPKPIEEQKEELVKSEQEKNDVKGSDNNDSSEIDEMKKYQPK